MPRTYKEVWFEEYERQINNGQSEMVACAAAGSFAVSRLSAAIDAADDERHERKLRGNG